MKTQIKKHPRQGGIAVLAAVLLLPLVAMLAFSVDYGYLLKQRARLQRAADAAALAAVRDLVPDEDGEQDFDVAYATVREYAQANIPEISGFSVLDSDIEIGRYDPATIYSGVTLLDDGIADTVRVTLRRDSSANSPVSLFFAHVLGIGDSDVVVTATAVLQKGTFLGPGSGVLPFTIPQHEWDALDDGEEWNVYGDGKIEDDNGNVIPGNWGTCDLGAENNSTSDLRDQIVDGLRQSDLDALHSNNRIPSSEHIDSRHDFNVNGDPGLSAGMKSAVTAVHGESRLVPVYDSVSGHGSGTEFHVVGWAVCKVVDSRFKGSSSSRVTLRKSNLFDGLLKPNPDLSATTGFIDGAFTSPALVE